VWPFFCFQVGLLQNGGGYRYFELALTLRDLGVDAAVVCPGPTFNRMADYFIVGEPEEKLLKLGELISSQQVGFADFRTLSDRMYTLPVIGYSEHNLPTVDLAPTGNTML
jgi:hypothetical protein